MNLLSNINSTIHRAAPTRRRSPTHRRSLLRTALARTLIAAVASTLGFASLTQGLQAQSSPAIEQGSAPAPAPQSNTTDMALLLMKEQRYVEALRILDASIGPRSTDATSLHLAGLALLLQNDHAKAAELLERALKLTPDDPAVVLNAAAARIRTGDSVRAAKFIYDALAKQKDQPNEPLVFGLIIAVDQIETNARKNRQYDLCVQLRDQAINALESARNTEKIWGVQWISARRFERIQLRNSNVRARINETLAQINSAQELIRKLKSDRETIIRNIRAERATVIDLDRVEARLAQQVQLADDASRNVVDLFDRLSVPVIPTEIPPRWPDNSLVFPPPTPEPQNAHDTDDAAQADDTAHAGDAIDPTPLPTHEPESTRLPEPGQPANTPPNQPTDRANSPEPARFTVSTRYATAISLGGGQYLAPASLIQDASAIDLIDVENASHPARLVRIDAPSGLALLRSNSLKLPSFALADRFDGGEIQAAGFPTIDLFNTTPKEFSGTATLAQGRWSVELETSLAVPGAPMIAEGRLVGLVLPPPTPDPANPNAASLTIVSPDAIRRILSPETAPPDSEKPAPASPSSPPNPLAKHPSDVVVLLVAWKRTPVDSD